MALPQKATNGSDDEKLTVGQVAKMYGVSDETVRRWCKKGAIAFVMVGPFRLKRITRSEAERHLKKVDGAN